MNGEQVDPAAPPPHDAPTPPTGAGASPDSPATWDVDVVLSSGRVARVRSIAPGDAEGVRALHARLSPESRLMRFFTPMPTLPDSLVDRFVNVDHHDRVALVMQLDDQLIAVGRYDRQPHTPHEAEVAFVVDDRFQGEGIGSLLLEHLAAIALEHGITKFIAETLASNAAMLRVFGSAGFDVERSLSGGIFDVSFPIEPTDQSELVRERRDHRATTRSLERLLRPTTVALLGDSARHLQMPRGADPTADSPPTGVLHGGRVLEPDRLEDGVDLAVVDVPPESLGEVLSRCASHDVGVVVVMSEAPDPDEMRRLTRFARGHGLRIVGPRSLGVANTDAAVGLHLFSENLVPPNSDRLVLSPGTVGVFTHSPALTREVVQAITDRKLGISSAVSAGDKADVSGNDLLEFWEDDDATDVVVLGVESFGNPRRFARLAERVGRLKPVIVLAPESPETTALCRRTGVVRATTVSSLAQTASVFALHPDWFHPQPANEVVMPPIDPEALHTANDALTHLGGALTDDRLVLVLRAVGLDGWSGPESATTVVGRQDPRFGPLVELRRPGAERSVALAPLTRVDLDDLASGSEALADVLTRVGAAVAEMPDLSEIVVSVTRHHTPARISARAEPNPNGVNQIVRYLS